MAICLLNHVQKQAAVNHAQVVQVGLKILSPGVVRVHHSQSTGDVPSHRAPGQPSHDLVRPWTQSICSRHNGLVDPDAAAPIEKGLQDLARAAKEKGETPHGLRGLAVALQCHLTAHGMPQENGIPGPYSFGHQTQVSRTRLNAQLHRPMVRRLF